MRLFSHLTTMPPRCLLVESSWTRRSFHGKSLPAPHLSPPLNKLKGMETAQKTHYLRILKKIKKAGKNQVENVPNFNPALCRLTEVYRTEAKILCDFFKCVDYSNY